MRGIKFVLILGLAIAGLALGTGAGASTGKPATAAKSPQIRDVIIKGGVRSLGPLPARAQKLLKGLRASDTPFFSCSGASTKSNTAAAQTCVWPASYTGQVACIQTSTSPTVTQTCDASQTGSTQANRALIIQIIWSMNPHAAQDGKQIVRLRQTNVTGANIAGISQYIKQSQGPGTPDDTDEGDSESLASPTASAVQTQNSHQTVHLRQATTGAGDNNAVVLQFLRQRERASNVGTLNQSQNRGANTGDSICALDGGSDALAGVTVDPNANQCVLSNQTSTAGHLNLGVNQDYNQFQRARKAASGFQNQGNDGQRWWRHRPGATEPCAVEHPDEPERASRSAGDRLAQRVPGSEWTPQRCGLNPRNESRRCLDGLPDVGTDSDEHDDGTKREGAAASAGHQSDLLQYFGATSGDVRATQTSNLNGDVTNWGCPAPGTTSTGPNTVCAAEVQCEAGGGDERPFVPGGCKRVHADLSRRDVLQLRNGNVRPEHRLRTGSLS